MEGEEGFYPEEIDKLAAAKGHIFLLFIVIVRSRNVILKKLLFYYLRRNKKQIWIDYFGMFCSS